jgi:glyoxylase-like metal-dependent hydrolase (beta-lactamase superfamily II)
LIAEGIHRLAIPTPFAVGRVNTYLIEDDPLTLVDSGPNSGRALDELQRRLHDRGHAIEDIGRILITHQHIDHIGLVDIIASHSNAEVAAIEQAVPYVENYSDEAAEDDRFAMELMIRHGIPSRSRGRSARYRPPSAAGAPRPRSPTACATATSSSSAIAR